MAEDNRWPASAMAPGQFGTSRKIVRVPSQGFRERAPPRCSDSHIVSRVSYKVSSAATDASSLVAFIFRRRALEGLLVTFSEHWRYRSTFGGMRCARGPSLLCKKSRGTPHSSAKCRASEPPAAAPLPSTRSRMAYKLPQAFDILRPSTERVWIEWLANGLPGERFTLGDFALVMGEDEVLTARVEVRQRFGRDTPSP